MQTIYYSTPNFIRHQGNIVDLGEYRRKLALAQEGSLAPQPEYDWEAEPAPVQEGPQLSVVQPQQRQPRPRRSSRREQRAWALEQWASLSVVAMALVFTLRVLFS